MNFLQFTQDQNLGGCGFPRSWYADAWETVIKVADAMPLTEAELALYRQHTGRQEPPQSPAKEINLICGRRSGKSRVTAEWGTYAAVFADTSLLGPGETGYVVIIGPTQKQANLILNYARAIFRLSPILAPMVVADVDGEIRLSNGTAITVLTCSSASVRGFTLLCVIFEETSSWRVDGADPGIEIERAVLPGLATTGGRRISIGSPRAMHGIDYEAYRKYYGIDSDKLVWVAPSRVMNPTLPQEVVDRALQEDYESAKAEYLAEFRSDLETFLDLAALEACVVQGRHELPARLSAVPRLTYQAFCDPSGGKRDAAGLAICHREGEVVVVDLARRWAAPHVPASVVAEQAQILKSYGLAKVVGDKYAGAWPSDEFSKHGIRYEASDRDKSRIYLDFLPLVMSGNVELLDNKTLISELRGLERRTRSGGRDSVDHPPGPKQHDDLGNATAGVCTLAAGRKKEVRSLLRSCRDPYRPEPRPEPVLHPRLQYKTGGK
jgi:hypothetical protein